MQSKSILTHQNHYLLKALGIQHEIQHETQHEIWHQSLIVMILNYWNMMCSLTWNWSQRKMNWIWNFVNDAVETEIWSELCQLGEWDTCGLLVGLSPAPTSIAFTPMVDTLDTVINHVGSTALVISVAPHTFLTISSHSTSNAFQLLCGGSA